MQHLPPSPPALSYAEQATWDWRSYDRLMTARLSRTVGIGRAHSERLC